MNSGNATQYDRTTINSTTEPDFSDIKANLDKGIPSSVELDVDVTDSFEATQRRELKEIESNPLLRNSGIV